MQWFHDLKTLAKLLGAFGVMCVCLAVVGLIGFKTSQDLFHTLGDGVGKGNVPSILAMNRTYTAINTAAKDVRSAMLFDDPTQAAPYSQKARDDLKASDQAFTDFLALPVPDDETAVVKDYQSARAQYGTVVEDILGRVAQGTAESHAAAMDSLFVKGAPTLTAIIGSLDTLTTKNQQHVNDALAAAAAQNEASARMLIALVAGSVVVAMGVGFYIASSIAEPLGLIEMYGGMVMRGDVLFDMGEAQRKKLNRKDEVGKITDVFRGVMKYMKDMAADAQRIAQGDLTVEVTPQSGDDLLGVAFQHMVLNLRELVGQVQASAINLADVSAQLGSAAAQTGSAVQQVTMAVQNVAAGAQETSRSAQETTSSVAQLSQVIDGIARGATDQARQVQTTSATATKMAAGVEEVATNATQMATAGKQTEIVAHRGSQAVHETTAAMTEIQAVVGDAASKVRELGVLSQKIGAVVETIDDIAEQTNLLALNAAIEAARAGEQGKGFAVVADEVRKLAERSGRETKQIAELITQVQTGTKDAVAAMDDGAAKVELGTEKAGQAGQALDEILAAVQDTVRQVGEIASSSQQMAAGARSVTDAMVSISAVVEESSAATEEMAAQASAVTGSIQSIAAVSEQQSAATEEVSASTEQMSAQVEQMAAQAEELAATAAQLKDLVAHFKLHDEAATGAAGARRPAAKSSARPMAKTVAPLRRVA